MTHGGFGRLFSLVSDNGLDPCQIFNHRSGRGGFTEYPFPDEGRGVAGMDLIGRDVFHDDAAGGGDGASVQLERPASARLSLPTHAPSMTRIGLTMRPKRSSDQSWLPVQK